MVNRLLLLLFAGFVGTTFLAEAQSPTGPVVVPAESQIVNDDANLALKRDLDQRRETLLQHFNEWNAQAKAFNAKYGNRDLDADTQEAKAGVAEQARVAKAMGKYNNENGQFTADVGRLRLKKSDAGDADKIEKLTKQIASDEEAIRRLGFQKRAADFEEWKNFSESTKNSFDQETVEILLKLAIDEAGAVTANAGEDKLASLTQKDANRWIKVLRDKGLKSTDLSNALREFASANNSQARVYALKGLTVATTDAAHAAVAKLPSAQDTSLLNTIAQTFVESVGTVRSPQMRLLVGEAELTSAIVYDSAAQNVSQSRINQMTYMTEDRLKALQKLSKTLQNHVKALNDLKKQQ